MGKKKGKKVSGAEKTALKTEKKADKKAKKELKLKGEDDIESLIAKFKEEDRKRLQITEQKCNPPSPRCNMTLTPHPVKDELIMFGGEYFDGQKTHIYNDLLFFNVSTQNWSLTKAPDAPEPRCAHQAVALAQFGGQLWIFGGEFASPTQSQFYHYKDLWVFHLRERKWEKVTAPGGPSARSGHRMAVCKRRIIVFGGFHDNTRDFKYFNDAYCFSLETLTWSKLEPAGLPPAPRSGCQMAAMQEQNGLVIYGGYSKERVKKDVDKGTTHSDMFILCLDEKKGRREGDVADTWRWVSVKQSGARPSPRCGFSLVSTPGNRAVLFGGIYDEEEDEEDVQGILYNEMYNLELESGKWHEVILRGKQTGPEKKKRRRKKETGKKPGGEENDANSQEDSEGDMEEDLKSLNVTEESTTAAVASSQEQSDATFTVTIGPQSSTRTVQSGDANSGDNRAPFTPHPRMNALLAVKQGVLYLYGGLYEDGDKQITLSDMYSLDLHKLDEWNVIIGSDLDLKLKEYNESETSSEDDEEDMDADLAGAAAAVDDEDSDMDEDAPDVDGDEDCADYFGRTKDFWLDQAERVAEKEGLEVTGRRIKKAATRMAEEFYSSKKS